MQIFTETDRFPESPHRHHLRMNPSRYHQMRAAIQVSGSPGTEADLALVEANLWYMLTDCGLFDEVEVGHTDDVDQLVIALCRFDAGYSEAEVATQLERIWGDQVRYPFWEAHTVRVYADQVEFEAASRHSDEGHYVTVHLVAQKARIPDQRRPVD